MNSPERPISTDLPASPPMPPRPRDKRWLAWLIVALVVIGGGIGLWDQVLKDRLIPKRWGVVEQGQIYRSGQLSESLVKPMLADNHIAVVVDLNGPVADDPRQDAEARAMAELGIAAHRFPLSGNGTGDIHSYANAIKVIDDAVKAGKPVLVHCSAGTQRTGGTVAAYRLLVQRRSPADAYRELESYDWDPHKDAILLTYLNSHMRELAGLLVQSGVLEKVPDPVPVLSP
jgi:protein tyrosine/serine phosphatase